MLCASDINRTGVIHEAERVRSEAALSRARDFERILSRFPRDNSNYMKQLQPVNRNAMLPCARLDLKSSR